LICSSLTSKVLSYGFHSESDISNTVGQFSIEV
jgi:hypothetical protein